MIKKAKNMQFLLVFLAFLLVCFLPNILLFLLNFFSVKDLPHCTFGTNLCGIVEFLFSFVFLKFLQVVLVVIGGYMLIKKQFFGSLKVKLAILTCFVVFDFVFKIFGGVFIKYFDFMGYMFFNSLTINYAPALFVFLFAKNPRQKRGF